MYFGQCTTTNSGIIGKDNYQWPKLILILHGIPLYHDMPAKNITLTGQDYLSPNILHFDNLTSIISTGASFLLEII